MHIVLIFNAENAHKYGINYFTRKEKLNSIIMEFTFSVIQMKYFLELSPTDKLNAGS